MTVDSAKSSSPTPKPLVILLSYYFPPSTAIGALRPYRFFKYLRKSGYDCSVVTATAGAGVYPGIIEVPDAPARWREDPTTRIGRLEAELERLCRRILLPGHLGITWAFRVFQKCRQLLKSSPGRPVVMFSTFPPLGPPLAALLVSRFTGIPWISDFRDPIRPGSTISGADAIPRRILFKFEEIIFRHAEAIVANVDSAAEEWRKLYPDSREKLSVIWNGYDPDDDVGPRPLQQGSERILLHAGSLYANRNANSLIETIGRLRQNGNEDVRNVQLRLLGETGYGAGIDEVLSRRAIDEGWLKMLPRVSPEEAQLQASTANGLILLQPHTSVQVPAKLFQYVCIGRPILAIAPQNSAVERVLSRSGVRNVCLYPDGSAQETEDRLISYLRMPTDPVKPSKWFLETFNASAQTQQLTGIIESLCRLPRA